MNFRSALARIVVGILALTPALAFAQSDYPNHPLRLLVGFPPGGSTDVLSRTLAQEARKALGQEIVVINKPGASGALSVIEVVGSPADGYTIGVTPSSTVTPTARQSETATSTATAIINTSTPTVTPTGPGSAPRIGL